VNAEMNARTVTGEQNFGISIPRLHFWYFA
jgi:hypothetical protein